MTITISEPEPNSYLLIGREIDDFASPLVSESQLCALCGHEIAVALSVSEEGIASLDTNPRSDEVAAALQPYSEARELPETRHPMCALCFIGWLHAWLDIGDKADGEA